VTGAADSDSRQFLRRAAARSRRVVATGCLAQRRPDALAALEGVSWVVGNQEKPDLAQWILDADSAGSDPPGRSARDCNASGSTGAPESDAPSGSPQVSGLALGGSVAANARAVVRVGADPTLTHFASYGSGTEGRRTRATLKIQDGCDEHCTFCVIPQVRGASRSRPLASVVAEAERLTASGYREIALTGINTALWGHDLAPTLALPELLRALGEVPGIARIRLNSIEPQYLCDEWIDAIASNPRVCRHLHLPLQSGDAAVLKRMNRRYGPAHYARMVERAAARIPDLAIGADVLVGFPGETALQFENTRTFLASLPLAYLHVFTYSERPETPAPRLGEEVPVEERKRRSSLLRELGSERRARFLRQLEGTVQEVLPEGPSGPEHWQGLTDNYARVRFRWNGVPENRLYRVRLEGGGSTLLSGTLIEDLDPLSPPRAHARTREIVPS
jgi:threonylcarbamoyladenosine tRNA methylthiotransferase MtaB